MILSENELEGYCMDFHFTYNEADQYDDPLLHKYLQYVRVLEMLEKKDGHDTPSADTLFYSRYYCFQQLKRRHFALYGPDEGLEQQSFRILEGYQERFPGRIDWSMIEQIDHAPLMR